MTYACTDETVMLELFTSTNLQCFPHSSDDFYQLSYLKQNKTTPCRAVLILARAELLSPISKKFLQIRRRNRQAQARYSVREKNRKMDRWVDGWMDGRTDGRMDGWKGERVRERGSKMYPY